MTTADVQLELRLMQMVYVLHIGIYTGMDVVWLCQDVDVGGQEQFGAPPTLWCAADHDARGPEDFRAWS